MKNRIKVLLMLMLLCVTFLIGSIAMAAPDAEAPEEAEATEEDKETVEGEEPTEVEKPTKTSKTEEYEIYYVRDEGETFLISVLYDVDDVTLGLKNPEGKKVSLTKDKNVTVSKNEGGTFITVSNAQAGSWTLVYNKGSNEKIYASAQPFIEKFWIQGLKLGKVTSECKLPVSFKVVDDKETYYNYEIRIGIGPEMKGEKVIYESSARTGEAVKVDVDLSEVASYKGYAIKVFAAYNDNGSTIFDEVVSDTFDFDNTVSEEHEAYEAYNVEIDKSAHSITVDLNDNLPWGSRAAFVTISADGKSVIEETLNFETQGYRVFAQYPEDAKKLETSVVLKFDRNQVSKAGIKDIGLDGSDGKFYLKPQGTQIQKNKRYEIDYLNASDNTVYIDINGSHKELVLNGKGTKALTLEEINNHITIQYRPVEYVLIVERIDIAIDNVAPILEIYENLDGINTSKDSIKIAGKTEAGSVLTVNGKECEVFEDGSFLADVALSDGANQIQIVSSDEIGNESVYVLNVNKGESAASDVQDEEKEESKGLLNYMALMVSLFISLFIAIELILVAKGKKNGNLGSVLQKMAIVFGSFAVIGLVGSIVNYVARSTKVQGKKFIELAAQNPIKANEALIAKDTATKIMVVFIILTVIAALCIVAVVIYNKQNTPEKKEQRIARKQAKEAAMEAARIEAAHQAELARQAAERQAEIDKVEAAKRQAEYEKQQAEAMKRQAEYEKQQAEEAAKRQAEYEKEQAEAMKRQAEYEKQQAEEAAKQKAIYEKEQAEAMKRQAEYEKQQAEETAKRQAEYEKQQAEAMKRQAEYEKQQAEEAAKRQAEYEKQQAEAMKRQAEYEKEQAMMAAQAQNQYAGKKFCPNCGTELDASAQFCPNCGNRL